MMAQNREHWLSLASQVLADEYWPAGFPAFRVTCGFPSRMALSRSKQRIGECWDGACGASDGMAQVHISPVLVRAGDVLATLLHEMIHVAVGTAAEHKAPFKRECKRVGLEGKPTATVPGETLRARLAELAAGIGDYPHAALVHLDKVKRQKGRLRLWECQCPKPVKVRVASDEFEATCKRCGEDFTMAGGDDADGGDE